MWIVILLVAVAVVVLGLLRGNKGVAEERKFVKHEASPSELSEEALDLLPFLDNPTAEQKAEYVRRRGPWPGYTSDDFAKDEELAKDFNDAVDAVKRQRLPDNDPNRSEAGNMWGEKPSVPGVQESTRSSDDDLPGFRPAR